MVEVGKLAIKRDEDLGALTETGSDRFDRRRDHGNIEGRAAQQGAGSWTPENTCSMFFRANRTATDLSPQRPHEMSELGVQERRANLLTLPDSLEASVSRAKHQAPSTKHHKLCPVSLCALYSARHTTHTSTPTSTDPHPHAHTHIDLPKPTSTSTSTHTPTQKNAPRVDAELRSGGEEHVAPRGAARQWREVLHKTVDATIDRDDRAFGQIGACNEDLQGCGQDRMEAKQTTGGGQR
jgi:hypothetical protein